MLSVEERRALWRVVSVKSIQESAKNEIVTRHKSRMRTLRGPVPQAFRFCRVHALMIVVKKK